MKHKKELFSSVISDISIKMENTATGIITEYPSVHNLITDNFKRLFLQFAGSTTGLFSPALRVGSGSRTPSTGDMELTSDNNWYGGSSGVSLTKLKIVIASLNSVAIHFYYVLPASAQYVGDITELGLYSSSNVYYNDGASWRTRAAQLLTHSLLKDAEGQPYTISKTDLDQLTIEYKITFTSQDFPIAFLVCGVRASNPIANASGHYIHRLSPTGISGLGAWAHAFTGGVKPIITLAKPLVRNGYMYSQFFSASGSSDTGLFLDQCLNMYSTQPSGSVSGTAASISACCDDSGHLTVPARRMPAQWYRNGYYVLGFSINAASVGDTMLPQYLNEELGYQDIDLDDYAVGVGDGVTTSFKPPLNYWKANTEEIFINGVKLERGVDYTCDPHNNIDNLPMFLPLFHAIIIDADWLNMYTSSSYTYLEDVAAQPNEVYNCGSGYNGPRIFNAGGRITVVPKLGISFKNASNVDVPYEPTYYGIAAARHPVTLLSAQDDPTLGVQDGILSSVHPYIFELPIEETKLDWAVDTAYIFTSDSNTAIKFSVDYSDDCENWVNVVSHVTGYKTRPSGTEEPHQRSLAEWCEYPLGGTFTKKYWRLSLHYDAVAPSQTPIYTDKRIGFIIKHTGGNIVFTTPPAAGASITMSAKSDILFKDATHVIDCGGTISM